MGTWSMEPFGNDTAADWAERLVKTRDLSYLETTLDAILESEGMPLESRSAEEAVAAAEVLAKLRGVGTQSDAYPAAVEHWLRSFQVTPSPELLRKAQRALERIRKDPKLQAEWYEAADAYAWSQTVARLESVLGTN